MKKETLESMSMLMLGTNVIMPHRDYRRGIGPKARKVKKAKRRQQNQSRRRNK